MTFRPTALDLALAENPLAEADSRAVAAAALPPCWTQVDVAARNFQRVLGEAQSRMVEAEISAGADDMNHRLT